MVAVVRAWSLPLNVRNERAGLELLSRKTLTSPKREEHKESGSPSEQALGASGAHVWRSAFRVPAVGSPGGDPYEREGEGNEETYRRGVCCARPGGRGLGPGAD